MKKDRFVCLKGIFSDVRAKIIFFEFTFKLKITYKNLLVNFTFFYKTNTYFLTDYGVSRRFRRKCNCAAGIQDLVHGVE